MCEKRIGFRATIRMRAGLENDHRTDPGFFEYDSNLTQKATAVPTLVISR
jgi:hypothetical protein